MDSTVTSSPPILKTNPRCGLRIGVDGRDLVLTFNNRDGLDDIRCLITHIILNILKMIGSFPLAVLFPTDLLKTLHLLWHGFTS
jgi:hypothetical protein